LQPHPNRDFRGIPSEKRKALLGTSILHGIVLILFLLVGFSVPVPPPTEQGILVNFGTDETGSGLIEPSPPAVEQDASPPPARVENTTPANEKALLTQDDEEAPEVKKVDPAAEKRRLEKIEADRRIREQMEAERKKREEEELERKRIEAEQKRVADIMNRTKNALAGSKNAGTSSTSEGVAGGPGNQGATTGSVDSKVRGDGSGTGDKGISYDLQGRGYQSLPKPKYDYQGEGIVVVEVSVDKSGKVIQAVPGVKGSTTLDEYLLRVAKEAAMAARFDPKTDAPVVQKGTITYHFILR